MSDIYVLVHNFKYGFMRVEEILATSTSVEGVMIYFKDRHVFRNMDELIIQIDNKDSKRKNDFTKILYTEGTEEYDNEKETLLNSERDFLLIRIYKNLQ